MIEPFSMPIASCSTWGAVGGAGRIRNDDVRGRQLVVVDTVDYHKIGILGRRRHQYPARAGFDVRCYLLTLTEPPRAFEHDVDAEVAPRQPARLLLTQDLDWPASDVDRTIEDLHFAGKSAVDGVVAQQVRVGLRRPEIVDRRDLVIKASGLLDASEHQSADPAEAVDADPGRHGIPPSIRAIPDVSIFALSHRLLASVRRPARSSRDRSPAVAGTVQRAPDLLRLRQPHREQARRIRRCIAPRNAAAEVLLHRSRLHGLPSGWSAIKPAGTLDRADEIARRRFAEHKPRRPALRVAEADDRVRQPANLADDRKGAEGRRDRSRIQA
jgi:hypothetical protein